MVCERVMVVDKDVCKRWCVTKLCVKDMVCERWCVTKGKRRRRRTRRRGGGAGIQNQKQEPSHKDVGKKRLIISVDLFVETL